MQGFPHNDVGSIGQPYDFLFQVFRHQLEGVIPFYLCRAAFDVPLYLQVFALLREGYRDLVIPLAVHDGYKELAGRKVNPRVCFWYKKNNRVYCAAALLYMDFYTDQTVIDCDVQAITSICQ